MVVLALEVLLNYLELKIYGVIHGSLLTTIFLIRTIMLKQQLMTLSQMLVNIRIADHMVDHLISEVI